MLKRNKNTKFDQQTDSFNLSKIEIKTAQYHQVKKKLHASPGFYIQHSQAEVPQDSFNKHWNNKWTKEPNQQSGIWRSVTPIPRHQLQPELQPGSACCSPGRSPSADTQHSKRVRRAENQTWLRVRVEVITFLESVEPNVFLGLKPAPWLLKADSSNQGGTSCCACQERKTQAVITSWEPIRAQSLTLDRTVTRERANPPSTSGSKNDTALPTFPQRPVLPIRWTYSSMSFGRSKFTTCWTSGMSRPRAATEVATRTGHFPERKSVRASSRSLCSRSLPDTHSYRGQQKQQQQQQEEEMEEWGTHGCWWLELSPGTGTQRWSLLVSWSLQTPWCAPFLNTEVKGHQPSASHWCSSISLSAPPIETVSDHV